MANMGNLIDRILATLPPSVLTRITSYSSTYLFIYRKSMAMNRQLSAVFTPIISTISSVLTNLFYKLASAPDLATVLLLVTILVVSMYVLDMIYRTLLWWIRMAFRLVFWGTIIIAGWYIYLRGIDGVVDDMSGIAAFWQGEYERFSQEAEVAARMAKQGLGPKPTKRGFGGGRMRTPWG